MITDLEKDTKYMFRVRPGKFDMDHMEKKAGNDYEWSEIIEYKTLK